MLPAFAMLEVDQSAEDYVKDAKPYLHHSCASAWESVDGDGEEYLDIISKMAGLILYNHEYDMERFNTLTEEEGKKLTKLYYDRIGELCKENGDALLAGVVEQSLIYSMTRVRS